MPTIRITEPFVARDHSQESKLVPEAALQTAVVLRGNSFVKSGGATGFAVAPATPVAGPADLGLAFAIEPGHNFGVVADTNLLEVQSIDTEIEINLLTASATIAQITPGARYGLSIDAPTGWFVLDTTKTAFPVMEVVGLPGRGQTPTGDQASGGSGGVADVNPRVIARILRASGV